jgi:prepilin-type N-terminal cleavage/methylation domain-containing protein
MGATRRSDPSLNMNHRARRGYTLVEVLVVVIILGILASLVTFAALWAVRAAERAAFAENLRTFANAAHLYRTEYGYYPPESEPGEIPDGFEKYIDAHKWGGPTPFGGKWHTNGGGPGSSQFGIGVSMSDGLLDENDEVLQLGAYASLAAFDAQIDNGNLKTGSFREMGSGKFYLVIAE